MRASALLGCAALLAVLGMSASAARAETLYVTDRLEIGVHESTDIDSVILAVIPSGTPLEVLGRNGEFIQVRTADGISGWVDGQYVVSKKPDTTLANEYDAKLEAATHALGNARADAEALRQRINELERDAATAVHPIPDTAAITDPGMPTDEQAAKLAETERALETMTAENRTLKSTVANLQADLQAKRDADVEAASSDASQPDTERYALEPQAPHVTVEKASLAEVARSWTVWQWLLLFFVLLLAFALGGFAVDWEMRRRHGGFRV